MFSQSPLRTLTRRFTLFGNLVTFANVVCITCELFNNKTDALSVSSPLYVWNMVFIVYYMADLVCKIWAQGWELYFWSVANVYEGENDGK